MWEAALERRSNRTRLAPAAVAGSLTTTFTLVTPHEDSEPNVERVAGLSKTPYQKAARPLPSCPPIFAKCARIASENFRWHRNLPSIAQCIGRAEQSCSRNDQICAVHAYCTPTSPSISASLTASKELRIAQTDLGALRSILDSVLAKSRTPDAATAPGVLES